MLVRMTTVGGKSDSLNTTLTAAEQRFEIEAKDRMKESTSLI